MKIITDEEIPHLIQADFERLLAKQKISKNPKYHRTEKEDELSYNFECKYDDKIGELESKFEDLYRLALKTKDLLKRTQLLEQAIVAFEKAKKFCYSKGKGGTIYFQDRWEHMDNSQNECFSYLDNIKSELDKLQK